MAGGMGIPERGEISASLREMITSVPLIVGTQVWHGPPMRLSPWSLGADGVADEYRQSPQRQIQS